MATLVLGLAGSAVGGALLPGGLSLLGTTIGGAALGGAIGSSLGRVVDNALFAPSSHRTVEGPRLQELQIQASSEGAPVLRVYGRARIAGQIIWATDFKEVVTETEQSAGGGKGGGGGTTVTTTAYSYFASFAVGLCEGEIARIGRVWADGKPFKIGKVTTRLYKGTETQDPDALIEAVEGAGNVPAYRGLAYIVFEDLPLEQFGNRVPQLTFEVFRPLGKTRNALRAVTMIPGATEFGYEPARVFETFPGGGSQGENLNNTSGNTDWSEALDQLEATLPRCQTVALVVTWFGTDLRCGACEIRPGVEKAGKTTMPEAWSVDGVTRAGAHVVSLADGRPAFGGTPSDASVKNAIADLKARGFDVVLYPFIMMDIPAGNALPDPYSGAAGQPAYPWRGRITCDPAPGEPGSPDKTAALTAEVDTFFNRSWGFRRLVLHYANLAAEAGGVEAFLIGSELPGLTRLRSSPSEYPAIGHLKTLAAEVKTILGPSTKVSYAADWAEYFGHHPADGSGDVFFHLDPLWADANIDFIGIDNYMPLADWRDGESHLDRLAGAPSLYDLGYLRGNVEGGEGYDWYYQSDADREAQTRTPITDGAYGKPWVFRYKDLRGWWENEHYDRPGGVENPAPTAWVPRSKPFWFTEMGCPAVDKGANQPNVFVDPKSSESRVPYFSDGTRDDLIQRRYLDALIGYWDPTHPDYVAGRNPFSFQYNNHMVRPAALTAWTWDARPHPDFPDRTALWADGANWRLGHWLTGRLGAVQLGDLVAALAGEVGMTAIDAAGLSGLIDGYVVDRIMSPREALTPLMQAAFFDAVESDGLVRFMHRDDYVVHPVDEADLAVLPGLEQGAEFTRAQETELPRAAKVLYIDGDTDYRQAAAESRRLAGQSERIASAALPIVMDQQNAASIAESWLQETWAARERARLALPPRLMAADPGDAVDLTIDGRTRRLRLMGLAGEGASEASAVHAEPGIYGPAAPPQRSALPAPVTAFGPVDLAFLDLPLLRGDEVPHAPYAAVSADPWPGAVALYSSPDGDGFVRNLTLGTPATAGRTQWDFYGGPTGRWDEGNLLRVELFHGALQSRTAIDVLNGANLAAIENEEGEWEVLQFRNAELVAPGTYELSGFLRGQGGTEGAMAGPVPAGARFVLIDGALRQVRLGVDERGLDRTWRYGPAQELISDVSYTSEIRSFGAVGLRPLSPVHLRARRAANGDIALGWIRRTRIGGDSWHGADVPLAEESEAYELEIHDGGELVRVIASASPAATYSLAQQTEDFGGPAPDALSLTLYQLSPLYGRGAPREQVIHVQ